MHKSVLLGEAIEFLKIEEGNIAVDATLGSGGHTIELAKKVGDTGKVIAVDIDDEAVQKTKKRIGSEHPDLVQRITFVHGNFTDLRKILNDQQLKSASAILADLGWRIEQIEDERYGLSFTRKARLDMRLDRNMEGLDARQIVNDWTPKQLEETFREYGEERHAGRIARAIVEARSRGPIETTTQLADIISSIYKQKQKSRLHPATKVFQALRIVVNNELENLGQFLDQSVDCLDQGGRIGVISFHSLEDRMVKNFFRTNARGCVCPKELPLCVCNSKQTLKVITKKPVMAQQQEVEQNPRARSAKLRVAEKI